MTNRLFFILLLLATVVAAMAQTDRQITVGTMNVDGLPPSITAFGVIDISVNPEGPQEKYTEVIGQRLSQTQCDIIGLNEDFNFHTYLTNNMPDYDFATHSGRFDASLAAAFGIIARTWRFKADGLELAVRKGHTMRHEDIQAWKDSYGYLDHDNDSLTHKGFRYYEVDLGNSLRLDVIILHADAGAWVEDIATREKQFAQLVNYINDNIDGTKPILIMGDFNSLYKRDNLQQTFVNLLDSRPDFEVHDAWLDCHITGLEPIDKIFFINSANARFSLEATSYAPGTDFLREDGKSLSDHFPVFVTLNVTDMSPTAVSDIATPTPLPTKRIANRRIIINRNGASYDIMGRQIKE